MAWAPELALSILFVLLLGVLALLLCHVATSLIQIVVFAVDDDRSGTK